MFLLIFTNVVAIIKVAILYKYFCHKTGVSNKLILLPHWVYIFLSKILFNLVSTLIIKFSHSCNSFFQDIAVKVTNSLVNIKAITAHFNPKIEAWLAAQQLSTPTEDQILEVVKSNYDSLTLKLQVFT